MEDNQEKPDSSVKDIIRTTLLDIAISENQKTSKIRIAARWAALVFGVAFPAYAAYLASIGAPDTAVITLATIGTTFLTIAAKGSVGENYE